MFKTGKKANEMKESLSLMIACLSFLLLLVFPIEKSGAYAQETIANLSKAKGDVEVLREGTSIPINPGMPILSGDTIKIEEGKAEVKFPDGSIIKIRPQSTVTIEKGVKKRKIKGTWTEEYPARTVKVERGEVFAKIESGGNVKTEFESLAADAVVKGTTLTFGVNDEGYTVIQSEEGVLDCTTQEGWITFTLSSGESVGAYICPPPENVVLLVCYSGTLEINVGNTTITLEAGEQIAAYYNPVTGAVSVAAVVGEIEVTSEGETVTVPEGLGTTCVPGAPPTQPTTPTIDPCYFVEPLPPAALMAPEPPPPPPTPPASPSR